jgi:WD40 repeat protein
MNYALAVFVCAQSFGAAPPPLLRDRDGDPLPRGAVARLGTARFRGGGVEAPFALTPDGLSLVSLRLVAAKPGGVAVAYEAMSLLTGRATRRPLEGAFSEVPLRDSSILIFPDGKTLLWFGDHDVRVSDLTTGKLLRSWPVAENTGIRTLAVSHDGRRVAVGTAAEDGGRVRVFDRVTGKRLREIHVGDYEIKAMAFTPGGRSLNVVSAFHVQQFDLETGKSKQSRYLDFSLSVELSPDGVSYLVAGEDVRLHDWKGGEPRLLVKKGENAHASFSHDGKQIVLARWDEGAVRALDTASGRLVRELRIPGLGRVAAGLRLAPGGRSLVAVGGKRTSSPVLWCWDAVTGERRTFLESHFSAPHQMVFSADGGTLTTLASDDAICRWDTKTGRLRTKADLTEGGSWWLLAAGGGRALEVRLGRLIDTTTGRVTSQLPRPDQIYAVSIAGDGRTLAVARNALPVLLWDSASTKRLGELPAGDPPPHQLQFSPGGRFLFGDPGTLWDVAARKKWMSVTSRLFAEGDVERTTPVWNAFFSHDGNHLFNTSGGLWQAWDLAGRREVDPRAVLGEPIRESFLGSPVFSPGGRLLATLDVGRALSLWETASGTAAYQFDQPVSAFAFSPCGRRLATASAHDFSVLVWDVPTLLAADHGSWDDLASHDAKRGLSAAYRLAAAPGAVGLLARRLRPAAPAAADRVNDLLTDLGSDQFERRKRAEASLAALSEAARPGLERLLRPGADLEARRRAERLLRGLVRPGDPERLRERRAVMALELIGDGDARALLRRLAAGLSSAFLTREARAALARLERK